MSFVKEWLEGAPYNRTLGVEQVSLSDDLLVLRLPFNEANTNPGGALHGGVAASLSVIGGQGVVRAALGAESGPWHTAGAQINYLAAAINEGVLAKARLLRRGKELCFVDVGIETEAGKPIAQANLAMRGRFGAAAAQLRRASGDDGLVEPGPMGS
ncbi:MAG TPA: PaaI family thioesterase, partial [Pseudomonadales bacterium]|nr:PaaI family thioesterase [Pseudomonadales bacterium]